MVKRAKSDVVEIGLRLKELLRSRLQQAAKRNDVSLNREMVNRLTDSFEYVSRLRLDEIQAGMSLAWAKFGDRFLRLELADDLKRALEARDEDAAITLVRAWVRSAPAPEQTP